MPTNRYDNIRPWRGQFSSLPIDMLAETLKAAQNQYDTNFLYSEQLKQTTVPALPQDQLRAQEIEKQWSSQIDQVVQKYSGDYSQASKDLYNLQTQMKKDLMPGGEAYSIQASYNNWTTELQKNKERLMKGDITSFQNDLFKNTLSSYEGVKKDPVTGAYNIFTPPTLANAVDYNKIAQEAASKIKPREVTRSIPTLGRDGRWKYETKTISEIDPQAVHDAVTEALVGTPGYASYMGQLGQLQGKDPQQWLQDVTTQVATGYANAYGGVYKDEYAVKYEADPFVKQQREFANQRALADLKYNRDVSLAVAKGEIQVPSTTNSLALLATTSQPQDKFKPVDPDNPKVGGGVEWGNVVRGLLQGPSSGIAGTNLYTSATKLKIDEVVAKPVSYRDNIDVDLLKAIRADNPGKPDSDLWRIYNHSLAVNHYGAGIYYDKFQTPEAQKIEADRVVPLLATGQVTVQKVDTRTGKVAEITDPSEISKLYKSYWDPEKRRSNVVSLGRTVSQGGDVNVGTVLPGDENSYYIVAENSERMLPYNTDYRHRAFDFIQRGDPMGTPVSWQEDGKTNWAVGILERKKSTDENGNTVYVKDPKYVGVRWEGTPGQSKWEPARAPYDAAYGLGSGVTDPTRFDYWIDAETKVPFTPAHIEDRLLGQYRNQFAPIRARSATKEYNNPIE